jgi:hypothetical protein
LGINSQKYVVEMLLMGRERHEWQPAFSGGSLLVKEGKWLSRALGSTEEVAPDGPVGVREGPPLKTATQILVILLLGLSLAIFFVRMTSFLVLGPAGLMGGGDLVFPFYSSGN